MKLPTLFRASILSFGIVTLSLSHLVNAQSVRKNDVIVKTDSSKIQALITQMTYEKINYRDLGTADSAKTYIYIDQVAKVLLKNGKIINVRDSVLIGHTPPDSVGQYADKANLPENKFERSIVMANSDQLRDKYQYYKDKAIDGKRGAIIFTSFGVASLVSGLVIANTGSDSDNKKIGNSLAIAGPVFGGVLGLVTFSNFKRNRGKAKKVQTELERRNQPLGNIKLTPGFDPYNKLGLVTFKMSF